MLPSGLPPRASWRWHCASRKAKGPSERSTCGEGRHTPPHTSKTGAARHRKRKARRAWVRCVRVRACVCVCVRVQVSATLHAK